MSDIAQVEFLCLCSSLNMLTLEGNPICSAPHPEASQEVSLFSQRTVERVYVVVNFISQVIFIFPLFQLN